MGMKKMKADGKPVPNDLGRELRNLDSAATLLKHPGKAKKIVDWFNQFIQGASNAALEAARGEAVYNDVKKDMQMEPEACEEHKSNDVVSQASGKWADASVGSSTDEDCRLFILESTAFDTMKLDVMAKGTVVQEAEDHTCHYELDQDETNDYEYKFFPVLPAHDRSLPGGRARCVLPAEPADDHDGVPREVFETVMASLHSRFDSMGKTLDALRKNALSTSLTRPPPELYTFRVLLVPLFPIVI